MQGSKGTHVAATDIADARLEANHAVAQAVHDGLALPRHALPRMRAAQPDPAGTLNVSAPNPFSQTLCWQGIICSGARLSCTRALLTA